MQRKNPGQQDNEDAGLISNVKEIYRNIKKILSPASQLQRRQITELVEPMVDSLEEMLNKIQDKYSSFLEAAGAEAGEKKDDVVTRLMNLTSEMIDAGKKLADVDFNLYIVANKAEADQVKSKAAIVIYLNKDGQYYAKVMRDNKFVGHEAVVNKEEIFNIIKMYEPYEKKGFLGAVKEEEIEIGEKRTPKWALSEDKKVVLTEKNIEEVDAFTRKLAERAGVPTPKKDLSQLVAGAAELTGKIPLLMDTFQELLALPMLSSLSSQLDQLKSGADNFNARLIAEHILPVDMYKKIRLELFSLLSLENFKKLSPDKKAAALALMEVYNQAVKALVLAMDKIEITLSLEAGSLASVPLVDGKSIEELYAEFNNIYIEAIKNAEYPLPELYPFKASLLKQREAMLEALPPDSPHRARIERRNAALGDVQPLQHSTVGSFYYFLKGTLKENYERVQAVRERLSKKSEAPKLEQGLGAPELEQEAKVQEPEQEQKQEEDISQDVGLLKKANQLMAEIEKALENALDKDIYQLYFVEEKQVDSEKTEVHQPHWIESAGKAFMKVKKITKEINELKQNPEDKKFHTPFDRLEFRAKQADALSQKTMELAIALYEVKENKILGELSKIKIPYLDALMERAKEKRGGVKAKKEHPAQTIRDKTKIAVSLIKDEIMKLQSLVLDRFKPELKEPLLEILQLATDLKTLHENLDTAADEKPNLLNFAYNHFSQIQKVLRGLPAALKILSNLPREEGELIAIEINKIIKRIVLFSDELEIQLCLKEGYLANRLAFLSKFQKQINNLGYDFPPEDRYPYIASIRAQRASLLAQTIPAIQRKLIEEREKNSMSKEAIFPSVEETAEEKAMPLNAAQIKANRIKAEMSELIQTHILHLSEQKDSVKISLLKQLVSDGSLEDNLEKLRKNNPKTIHLLYEGRTATVLKKLEYKSLSPDILFHELTAELEMLKKQRGTYYFNSNKQLLEKRIIACEKLQMLIKNNNRKEAFRQLDPTDREILSQYDRKLLDHLEFIEKAISKELRTKTILSGPAPVVKVEEEKEAPSATPLSPENQYILNLIDARIDILENAFFKSNTNREKYEMIRALKTDLKRKVPLESAILKIKKDNPDKAYLLFEGETGKMIQAAQNAAITSNELIHRLDAEINQLKQQRYKDMSFFVSYRKEKIDTNIQALHALKKAILYHAHAKNISVIITELSPDMKAVLQRYEPDLLKDLKAAESFSKRTSP
ncbi:MAG: hypothetical protein K0R24_405 [Gammaproteobacteria bacterium]|jgi:hypothetical protein|nr:hypothetical protein [Gammaproteobacteria bacterium]